MTQVDRQQRHQRQRRDEGHQRPVADSDSMPSACKAAEAMPRAKNRSHSGAAKVKNRACWFGTIRALKRGEPGGGRNDLGDAGQRKDDDRLRAGLRQQQQQEDRALHDAGQQGQRVGRDAAEQAGYERGGSQGADQRSGTLGGQQAGPGGVRSAEPVAIGPEQEGPKPPEHDHVGDAGDNQAGDLPVGADHTQKADQAAGLGASGRHVRGDRQACDGDGGQGDQHREAGESRVEASHDRQAADRRTSDFCRPGQRRSTEYCWPSQDRAA